MFWLQKLQSILVKLYVLFSDLGLSRQIPILQVSCDLAKGLMRNLTGISEVEDQWMKERVGLNRGPNNGNY